MISKPERLAPLQAARVAGIAGNKSGTAENRRSLSLEKRQGTSVLMIKNHHKMEEIEHYGLQQNCQSAKD